MFEDDLAGLDLDLPPAAERVLILAGAAWADAAAAEAHVLEAVALAPDSLATRIGAYKFYFYRNRLAQALPYAADCLSLAARRLNRAQDWRLVSAEEGGDGTPWARLWLQSLIAYGYVQARLGQWDEAREALEKAAAMDRHGAFAAARLLAILDRGGDDDDDE